MVNLLSWLVRFFLLLLNLETVYPKLTIVENKGFLPLRNHKAAHPQMIEIAKMIAEDIAVRFPNETGRIINYFE